ncbi:MAG: MlaD family protein [Bacteroidota bacterium]
MSRETRIGILTVLVIGASIWGYKFIKGQNLLSSQQFFYAEYSNVGQMQPSTPVFNRGLQIGTVTDIYQKPDDVLKVVVEMEVDKDFRVPKTTIAEIRQTVMGDKSIELIFSKICSGEDCAESGAYLKGVYKSIAATVATPSEVEVYMSEVTKGLKEVIAGMSEMVNDPNNVMGKSMADLQATLANLKMMSGLVNKELRRNGKINDILVNVDSLTGSIETAKVKSLLANADQFSGKLNEIDMQGLSNTTDQTLKDAQEAIKKLTATMQKAEGTINSLNSLLAKINEGEGTLGKIANDDDLYDELKMAAKNTNKLMVDLQQRPDRYVPFKSSRKVKKIDRKRPLVMPEEEEKKEGKN